PDGERDRPPGTVEVVRLVARREVVERLRAKSYYIFTGLLVLGVLAIGLVNRLAGDDGPGTIEVGLAQPAPEDLGPAIAAAAATVGREATTTSFDDAASARAAVEDDEVDVAVVAEERQVVFAE